MSPIFDKKDYLNDYSAGQGGHRHADKSAAAQATYTLVGKVLTFPCQIQSSLGINRIDAYNRLAPASAGAFFKKPCGEYQEESPPGRSPQSGVTEKDFITPFPLWRVFGHFDLQAYISPWWSNGARRLPAERHYSRLHGRYFVLSDR